MNETTAIPQPAGVIGAARSYLAGFPDFAAYFALALLIGALFVALYSRLTPHHEFRLIREGNPAAVPALLGAMLGFALPMSAAMGGAASRADFALWSMIAAAVQVGAYWAARAAMPDVSERITRGDLTAGVWLGGMAVTIGVLNAAAMTY